MAEYIEREAAIDAVKKERNYTGKFTFEEEHAWAVGFQQGITFALSDVAAIPAADVAPVVRGKWTLNKDGSGTCSECGFVQNSCWDLDNWDNFCHHCGADMRPEPPKEE